MKDITEYIDLILQAKEEAFKKNIKANSIAINKNLVYVKETILHANAILSPMICGLEIVTVNDLPDNYAFAVYKSKRTREDILTEKVRKETAREILKMLIGHEMRDKGAHMAWVIVKQDVAFIAEKYGIDLFEKTEQVGNSDKLEEKE